MAKNKKKKAKQSKAKSNNIKQNRPEQKNTEQKNTENNNDSKNVEDVKGNNESVGSIKNKIASVFVSEKYNSRTKGYYALFVPVILVLGYLPMFMYTLTYNTYLTTYEWWSASNAVQIDVFLKIKAIVLLIIASLMIVIMISWVFTGKKEVFKRLKGIPFYLLGGAVAFVILSGIFAKNKSLLLNGGFENFESIFVTLSYFVTMIYTYLLFSQSDSKYRDFQFVYRASLPGYLIVTLIGFFQVFGLDLFKTEFGQMLFVAPEYLGDGAKITLTSGAYTTLHNVDYVSVFFGMWAVVFLILFSLSKDTKEKVVRGALIVLTVFVMFMAGTAGGRLAFLASLLLLVVLIFIKNKKALLIIAIGTLAVVLVAFAIPQFRNKVVTFLGWSESDKEANYKTHHITPQDDGVYFDLDGKEYSVAYSYEKDADGNYMLKVNLRDANGNPINGTYHAATAKQTQYYDYSPNDITKGTIISEYDYEQGMRKLRCIAFGKTVGRSTLVICNQVDKSGQYYFMNPAGKFVRDDGSDTPEADIFPDNFMSGRGKIWNKTLPILKDYLLVGSGSGLFITAYPQDNYIYSMYGSSDYDVKPHNMYLQYWVEEGLPFLLLMLAFFILYYVKVIKNYIKNKEDVTCAVNRRISLSCMLAVTVYLISAIVNDSMIVYSPIFWTFLGLGMATGMNEDA